jgi:hypothetical protein
MKKLLLFIPFLFLIGCTNRPKEYLCSTSNPHYSPDFQRSLSLRPLNYISQLKSYFGIEEYELLFGVENYPVTCGKSGNAFTFGKKGENCENVNGFTHIQFDPINGSLVVFYPKDIVIWGCSRQKD